MRFLIAAVLLVASTTFLPGPPAPNGTTDGRYHTCGFITEDGVTEHMDAYWARCGDSTFASDT